ncbi:hypothetical protein PR048_004278 [Dryococelus australis]|uniref:Uncharacterized protein n=1 Tax=Dryococelus australis TaxID=614101 RepID=A0ABQ9I6Y3_9NEOP|nr:hypothetical protein PR048_004278 [Dryococelus australis]
MRAIELNMEQRRSEGVRETGDPRENAPTNGIVRHDSHLRKCDPREDPPTNGVARDDSHVRKCPVTRPRIEPGAPRCEESGLTSRPPRPRMARWLGRSPPTTAIRARSLVGPLPDFRMRKSVLDDAACRRAFSGHSRFPRPCTPAPLRPTASLHVLSCSSWKARHSESVAPPWRELQDDSPSSLVDAPRPIEAELTRSLKRVAHSDGPGQSAARACVRAQEASVCIPQPTRAHARSREQLSITEIPQPCGS